MVYAGRALRRQQLHVATAMQQPNSAITLKNQYTTWMDIQKYPIKGHSHSFWTTHDKSAESLLKRIDTI